MVVVCQLGIDLAASGRLILPGTKLAVQLRLASDNIMLTGAVKTKVKIMEAELRVRRVLIQSSVATRIAQRLQEGMRYSVAYRHFDLRGPYAIAQQLNHSRLVNTFVVICSLAVLLMLLFL